MTKPTTLTSIVDLIQADANGLILEAIEDSMSKLAAWTLPEYKPLPLPPSPPIPSPPEGWSVERVRKAVREIWDYGSVSWDGTRFEVDGFEDGAVTFDTLARLSEALGTKRINLSSYTESGVGTFDSDTPCVRIEITP